MTIITIDTSYLRSRNTNNNLLNVHIFTSRSINYTLHGSRLPKRNCHVLLTDTKKAKAIAEAMSLLVVKAGALALLTNTESNIGLISWACHAPFLAQTNHRCSRGYIQRKITFSDTLIRL